MRGTVHFRITRFLVAATIFAFAFVSDAKPPSGPEMAERLENGFAPISLGDGLPKVKLTLQEIMEISNVTQLSIAVVDDYKIDWAKGYGVIGDGVRVDSHTLFPAASISKVVTAMAAMRLVEEGKLALDENVNERLKTWKVPENEFTKTEKVTLRRILTHSSGTNVHGFAGYTPGSKIPSLTQILDGADPATTEPVRVQSVPGTHVSYSGGGYLILQQLMMDVTGQSFPELVKARVLDKLHLKESSYNQTYTPGAAATAVDRNGDGLPTNVIPELAVGGLWTTPSDLARIGIELALCKHGLSQRVISCDSANEMLREQLDSNLGSAGGPDTRAGLGLFIGGGSDWSRFEHSGVNIGFTAKLIMWDSGHGVAIMSNNWSFETECLMRYVINKIAELYGWEYRYPTFSPWPYGDTVVLAAAKLHGAAAAIECFRDLRDRWRSQQGKRGQLRVVWASNPPDYAPNEWDLFGVAQAYASSEHLRGAIEIAKAEVADYPKFEPAQSFLGKLFVRIGDNSNALAAYKIASKLQPDDVEVMAALRKLGGN